MLGMCRALVLTVSFSRLSLCFGQPKGSASFVPVLDKSQQQRAHLVGRTIELVARHTPWNSNCLAQAFAARLLLGLYGIPYSLHFGLRRDLASAEMVAHAWVNAGRAQIPGGESFDHFSVVAVFSSMELSCE